MLNRKLRSLKLIRFQYSLLLVAAVAVTNTSSASANKFQTQVIAHKAVSNAFDLEDMNCPTRRMKIKYPYIENTIPSVAAAAEERPDYIEIDVRVDKDNELVLFHDEEVSCVTNGQGKVKDLTLKQLSSLDVGYNLSPDNGKTFPFRGKGKGLIVTLEEVLRKFPHQKFLLNPKDTTFSAGEALSDYLLKLSKKRDMKDFMFWGSQMIYGMIKQKIPEFGRMIGVPYQRPTCYGNLYLYFHFGYFPQECQGGMLNIGPDFWKDPSFPTLLTLAEKYNTTIVLWAVNTRKEFIGLYGLTPYLITSDVRGIGPREVPFN